MSLTSTSALFDRPLPPLSRLALSVAIAVFTWETRTKTRRSLRRLDDRLLRDIGLDPAQAGAEGHKRFWQD